MIVESPDTCIICGFPITSKSIEHILPDALGGKITICSVCKDCNNKLGDKVDNKLTDSIMFEWIRTRLGIKNRDGKTPNLYKYYKDENGNKIIVKHGDGITMPEFYDGSKTPEFDIISLNGNVGTFKFSGSDVKSIVRRAQRAFEDNGIEVTEDQIINLVIQGSVITAGTTHVDIPILYEPLLYAPCYYKMAYEIMCTLFSEYTSDPRGEEIRILLYTWINGSKVNIHDLSGALQYCFDGDPVNSIHAYFSIRDGKLFIDITLFNKVFMAIPVSDDPSCYFREDYNRVNIFDIFANKNH